MKAKKSFVLGFARFFIVELIITYYFCFFNILVYANVQSIKQINERAQF